MSHLVSRVRSKVYELRNTLAMLAWDSIMGIVLITLIYELLHDMESDGLRIFLMVLICVLIASSIVFKNLLFYRKRGRDDITGGKNKREFERISSVLLKAEGEFAVVYANIDRFKLINDTYGNAVGDKVLCDVHRIIDDELLQWDEVSGRIMADNFGMLMRFHSLQMLETRLIRINDQLAQLRDENDQPYGLRMYFGVCLVENKNTPISSMLEWANIALRKMSTSAQHFVQMAVYDDKERQKLGREKELEMKMERALRNGEFVPFLQPKYELTNETIGGAEALVRWMDPVEGMIFPGEFIPLFEKNGFIVELDLYMFEQVCRMIERWNKEGYPMVPVSVNMSRGHFTVPGFFQRYRDILNKYEIPENSIEIELTESLFYNELSMLKGLINEIHDSGMLCSIDDFGSGYSSLNMLKEVRVDALKLDRAFFKDVEDEQRGKKVIDSVFHLAQSLNLRTISEGIEIRDQVDYLKQLDCDFIQGYVFAKPMPVAKFEELAFAKAGT